MIKEQIIQWRRHIHQNPEIGYETVQTSDYVEKLLKSFGYETTRVIHGAGVVARLRLQKDKTIAFRSDLDALPIQEKTNLSYQSTNQYMHACGHDAHAATLLGAAKLISEHQKDLNANIVLLFQPAEEGPLPGGAIPLMGEYDLSDVQMFFAFHVTNKLSTGQIGIKQENACAAPDLWECKIQGKGCHGSTPHLGVSPILPTAQIILRFQALYDSIPNPNTVISTTYIHSGVSMNVICEDAYLKGTARSFSKEERDFLATKMEKIVQEECEKVGARGCFVFHYAYDPVYNDPVAVKKVCTSASHIYQKENILMLEKPEMVGEDFSFYRRIAPTCLTWIGVRGPKQEFHDLHSPNFILDENALENAAKLFFEIAKSF